jgi:hypothetical protein
MKEEEEEEPAFDYDKYYSNKMQDFLKINGFFDAITNYGKTFRKYKFPPPTPPQKGKNLFEFFDT